MSANIMGILSKLIHSFSDDSSESEENSLDSNELTGPPDSRKRKHSEDEDDDDDTVDVSMDPMFGNKTINEEEDGYGKFSVN